MEPVVAVITGSRVEQVWFVEENLWFIVKYYQNKRQIQWKWQTVDGERSVPAAWRGSDGPDPTDRANLISNDTLVDQHHHYPSVLRQPMLMT